MSDTVVVYWGHVALPTKQTHVNLLWKPPVNIATTLPKGSRQKNNNYHACSGFKSFSKNTYTFIHPIDYEVGLSGSVNSPLKNNDPLNLWVLSPNAFDNQYRIDYDFGWFFFAEEPVVIQQTPPFLHKTTAHTTATMPFGSFDISKWFRPIILTYLLWENESTIKVTKGDPAIYLNFLTDKKVILKQFEVTEEIMSLSLQSVQFKNLIPFEPLSSLYDRFTSSKRNLMLSKLIKRNLLE